jgi:hypothetical protein
VHRMPLWRDPEAALRVDTNAPLRKPGVASWTCIGAVSLSAALEPVSIDESRVYEATEGRLGSLFSCAHGQSSTKRDSRVSVPATVRASFAATPPE